MTSIPPVTITYLEMRSPAEILAKPDADEGFMIRECPVELWQLNRFLYLAVGESCGWNSKSNWSEDQWRNYADSKKLRTVVAYFDGIPIGYFELNENGIQEIEIVCLGLIPEYRGQGLGGVLLSAALKVAWKSEPQRVWVRICRNDHEIALANYQSRGMKVYRVDEDER